MNAIIKQPPCACCQEKSQEIAQMQSAFAQEVSGLMDTILSQKEAIAALEAIIAYEQVRTEELVAHGRRYSADLPAHSEQYRLSKDRRQFRGAWEAQKRAEAQLKAEVAR